MSTKPSMTKSHLAAMMNTLTDEVTDGFALSEIQCRACSGFGNCGFKQYYLNPNGNDVVSICLMVRKQLQCKRDRIPFSIDLINY